MIDEVSIPDHRKVGNEISESEFDEVFTPGYERH